MEIFRKHRKLVGGIIAALTALLLGSGVAYASTRDIVLGGTTDHSIYRAARTLTITGTVNGDIFCAGQTVNINAEVFGDVMCAGQTVSVNGVVHGSIRIAGQAVTVGAVIDRSATFAAQDATLLSNGSVAVDAGVFAETSNIDGSVGRDVRAAGENLIINNVVGRDVEATLGDKLTLANGAKIGGQVNYTSPRMLDQSTSATVGGGVTYHEPESKPKHSNWGRAWLATHLIFMVAMLTFAMVLIAWFPQKFADVNKSAAKRFWATLLTGFLTLIIVPAILLVLLVSVIGWVVAFAVLGLIAFIVLLSAPVSAYYVGSRVLTSEKKAPIIMLGGSLLLALASLLPIVGWLVAMLAVFYGTGSLVHYLKASYKKPRYSVQ